MHLQSLPSDPDQLLVTRSQCGDKSAFDELVLKYAGRLYGLVYQMTSDHEDTRDLLQEVFTRAYLAIERFHGRSTFYTWIYQISVNLTLNFLKKRKRRAGVTLSESELQDCEWIDHADEANPERKTNLNELQAKLDEAMMRLSETHREVVTMYDIQGMPHGEIARVLDISEGTIRSRLHYAHLQLQSALRDSWEERF